MNNIPKIAVILAAGRGIRLGPMGLEHPKGFIVIGELPIIEESIQKLIKVGVDRIIIVTGHLREFYEALAGKYFGLIELVTNEKYAMSGSMYSLYLARNSVNEDFMLLESDLIYEIRALDSLFSVLHYSSVLLLSGETKSDDEVYASADNGFINGLSKTKSILSNVVGELVGISYIKNDFFQEMINSARLYFKESLYLEYEQAIVMATKNSPIKYCLIEDLAWSEIDCESHLNRAVNFIYPRISKAEFV